MAVTSGTTTHFNLLDVQKQYRARRWQDVLCGLYYRSDFRIPDDVQTGRIEGFSFDGFVIGRIESGPMVGVRTASHVACSPADTYVVAMAGEQPATMTQSGRVVRVRPGQFTLISAMEPSSIHLLAPSNRTSLVIPGALVRRLVSRIDEHVAIPFGHQPLHRMFHAMAMEWSLSARQMTPCARALVARSVVDLLGLVINGADALSAESAVLDGHRRRIERIVGDSYADPALGPAFIASRMNLSLRHIRAIMAARGTTVGRLIKERRIAEALKLLGFGAPPNQSLHAIAQAVGYTNVRQLDRDMEAIGGLRTDQLGG